MDKDLLGRSDQEEKSVADAEPPAERERVLLQEFAVDGVPSAGHAAEQHVARAAARAAASAAARAAASASASAAAGANAADAAYAEQDVTGQDANGADAACVGRVLHAEYAQQPAVRHTLALPVAFAQQRGVRDITK